MPQHYPSRRCAHPGCRAWAQRGFEYCHMHLKQMMAEDITQAQGLDWNSINETLEQLAASLDTVPVQPRLILSSELNHLNNMRRLYVEFMTQRIRENSYRHSPPNVARMMRAWLLGTEMAVTIAKTIAVLDATDGDLAALMADLDAQGPVTLPACLPGFTAPNVLADIKAWLASAATILGSQEATAALLDGRGDYDTQVREKLSAYLDETYPQQAADVLPSPEEIQELGEQLAGIRQETWAIADLTKLLEGDRA